MITDTPPSQPVLISDFDGTMTQRDFYREALARLLPSDTPDYWEDYLAGRLTHFEALANMFRRIRANEVAMLEAAHAMGLEAGLHESIACLQLAGWEVIIASAGCDWYIRRLLVEQQVQVKLYANPGEFDPAHGLIMTLPVDSPYFSPNTGIDKEAIVQRMVEAGRCVAFAGDGQPDLPAAMLVPPQRRFARGWLADYLSTKGIPFQSFSRWAEISEYLLRADVYKNS